MTPAQWRTIKHFASYEFDSPDDPGSGDAMEYDFVRHLDMLRTDLGFPLIITSGFRTPKHNKEVGGVDSSAHEKGWAADIAAPSARIKFLIVATILKRSYPIQRIGVGDRFVHLDMDPSLPAPRLWTY